MTGLGTLVIPSILLLAWGFLVWDFCSLVSSEDFVCVFVCVYMCALAWEERLCWEWVKVKGPACI